MTKEQKSMKVALKGATVEGEKTVRAVVTAPTLDRDYDIVDTASLRLPLKKGGNVQAKSLTGNEVLDVPFLLNHSMDVENVIGSARSAKMNAQGELEMVFGLSSLEKAQNMYTLLSEGHLDNAFSITFHDYEIQDGVMKDAEILEVSLVWRGSNKDARLLEVSKMLTVEKEVDSEETETKEEAEAETEVEETNTEETKTETTEEVEEVESQEETEDEETEENKETEEEVQSDDTDTESEDKENNKENKMTKEEIAAETVVESKEVVVDQPKKTKAVSKAAIRKNFVQQVDAIFNQKPELLAKFVKEGAELEGVDVKTLDLSGSYLSEVVSSDLKTAYVDAGGVGRLVNTVDITGADIFKTIVETSGTGFQATALGGEKPVDQPVWSPVSITPYEYALIVPWLDGAAQRTPLAVYNNVVKYIATSYKKLEDQIILTQEAETVDGESRGATGLVPLLQTAGRSSAIATDYSAENLVAALATAFGNVQSDGQLTLVANRATWASIATSQDDNFNTIFNVVGDKVTIGALGTFNVETSQVLPNGAVVIGVFSDYTLVTRGGLSTLFSQEAMVGELNLFQNNASAIRASVNIAGKAVPITSFWLLTAAGYVS